MKALLHALKTLVLFTSLALPMAEALAQPHLYRDEYALIGYYEAAVDNPVARLMTRLESGEQALDYRPERGYLDALLEALEIPASSQTLVFSKTSLQYRLISWEAPRAIFFSENTYIGWVQGSDVVEITTMDERVGPVFYVFHNRPNASQPFERENQRCLVCHDSTGSMGGGIPLVFLMSAVVGEKGSIVKEVSGEASVTDQMPVHQRWGGWYVTGESEQPHLGNFQATPDLDLLGKLEGPGTLPSLEGMGFFDTTPFPVTTSDIVALMIMEHQATIQNQLTYIRFKAPAVLGRLGLADETSNLHSWDSLPPRGQQALGRMLDKLVQLLLFSEAAPLEAPISGNAEFSQWFQAQGEKDAQGRSLRDLELQSRMFRYPLSYLVYSADFLTLPEFAKDYVYQRISAVLKGELQDKAFAHLSDDDRKAIREILSVTHPAFASHL